MRSEAEARKIAEADAVKAYSKVSQLQVRSELRDGRWARGLRDPREDLPPVS
jgi:hypothetical protein